MTKVFISYRHDDAATAVAWITHTLCERYGKENVFEYKDHAEASKDFRQVIGRAIRKCDVMLAFIGKRWKLGHDDPNSINRINDWVRIEIETALNLALPIVPVLVEGAAMPAPSELPNTLEAFAFKTAVTVDTSNSATFVRDVGTLTTQVDKIVLDEGGEIPAPSTRPLAPATMPSAAPPPPSAPSARPFEPAPGPWHPGPVPPTGLPSGKSYRGMAITAFVLSIVGFFLAIFVVLGPIAMAIGAVARARMGQTNNRDGADMALAAMIISGIDIAASLFFLIAVAMK